MQLPPTEAALTAEVRRICRESRNNPPQDSLNFLTCLNACLPRAQRFRPNTNGCMVELLTTSLEELPIPPGFLVTHSESGQCANCGQAWLQVSTLLNFMTDSTALH